MATTTTVPDIKLGQNGSEHLNALQIAPINTNFTAVAADYAAADVVVTNAFIAADAVIQDARAIVGTITPVDNTNTTATVTIQVLKGGGVTTVGKATRVNCWLSETAGTLGGIPHAADTSLVVATGTEKMVLLAAADLDVLSATNGVIVLTVSNADTTEGSLFCNAEIAGVIISAEVTITTA